MPESNQLLRVRRGMDKQAELYNLPICLRGKCTLEYFIGISGFKAFAPVLAV
jgi:hypothetical protein